jgi:hypothetical protein
MTIAAPYDKSYTLTTSNNFLKETVMRIRIYSSLVALLIVAIPAVCGTTLWEYSVHGNYWNGNNDPMQV